MQNIDLTCNVEDTALIFEGGGMRCSNTAGVVRTLLEAGIYFADVYGISAGSSHTVNYLSRDLDRARDSFTVLFDHPGLIGAGSFMRGTGYFNAPAIYQESAKPTGIMPFDFETFMANPAQMHIQAFDRQSGQTATWTKDDTPTLEALMLRVRASSSLPWIMPATYIGGRAYVDGGLGSSWGVLLKQAQADGYKRFFVVCTQERGYRKHPATHTLAMRLLSARHPLIARRTQERPEHYNAIYDELDDLEAQGAAYVYHPAHMTVRNTTSDTPLLQASYQAGYTQAQTELPAMKRFLGLDV
jgi:predicted patatin/cPLA2 family phospholipase